MGTIVNAAEAAGTGIETIEIVETVTTKTLGKVVMFRQWVTDPDGADYVADFVLQRDDVQMRSEASLRRSLAAIRFDAAL
jgi:hypothetical protein